MSVSAVLSGSTLELGIDSSSTAYLRQSGTNLEVADNPAYTSPTPDRAH